LARGRSAIGVNTGDCLADQADRLADILHGHQADQVLVHVLHLLQRRELRLFTEHGSVINRVGRVLILQLGHQHLQELILQVLRRLSGRQSG